MKKVNLFYIIRVKVLNSIKKAHQKMMRLWRVKGALEALYARPRPSNRGNIAEKSLPKPSSCSTKRS